jgi:UDP-glucose 4-epimerase
VRPLWLVTGGAGFIGSHLVEALVRRGERVRVFDNLFTGKLGHLAAVRDRIAFQEGDLRDPAAVRRAVQGVRYVSHQAALRSVPVSMKDPLPYADVNVKGSMHLLAAAKAAGVKRVVLASSSSVYGDQRVFPQREDLPCSPLSPYAASKLAMEHMAGVWHRSYGLETVCLRYFNVFGPRQDPASQYAVVVPRFILAALRGRPLEVHWDGRQARDFSYIDNVVEGNLRAARAPRAAGEVLNIAVGESNSVLDLVRELERLAGRRLPIRRGPRRPGDIRRSWADVSKARRLAGYRPAVPFAEGLRRTWEHFQGIA